MYLLRVGPPYKIFECVRQLGVDARHELRVEGGGVQLVDTRDVGGDGVILAVSSLRHGHRHVTSSSSSQSLGQIFTK